MIFRETTLAGAYVIELQPNVDARGFFARSYCRDEFETRGLMSTIAQSGVSFTERRGTLRGMHFQLERHADAKLVRCTHGTVWDVVVDLRPDSDTYCQWHGAELSAGNRKMVYVPIGCAHGFLTLEDSCEVTYLLSKPYAESAQGGVRYDDPVFAIDWPEPVQVIAERDRAFPDYERRQS